MKKTALTFILIYTISWANAQSWDINKTLLRSFKPVFSNTPELIDLDKDGDPDLIKTSVYDSIPAFWIDDDDGCAASTAPGGR